jgi:leucyl aminopeptidase
MNISIVKDDITTFAADTLVFGVFEKTKTSGGVLGSVDKALGGLLAKEMQVVGFAGKEGSLLIFHTHGKIAAARVLLVGLGEQSHCSLETIRKVSAIVQKKSEDLHQKHIASVLFGVGVQGIAAKDAARAMAEGALLAAYQYDKYHDEKAKKKAEDGLKAWTIVEKLAAQVRSGEQGLAEGMLGARGTILARDLVNEPASIATPRHLVEHAKRIAAEQKNVSVEIFDREEAQKRGMEAFLAVAAGATEEPYFIHLTYKPKGAKRRIALVGKGITFDSGGLQIKPGDYMTTMKCDMAGAAAVLGVFSVISEVAPPVEVHGIIAATENMPGKSAYKPGDVVRAMNGKTIEIGHTDAEGRVTLADALSFAMTKKPDVIIDLATLTGACVAALGEEIAGIMSNNQKLCTRLLAATGESGERLWELPLAPEYDALVKSDIADIKNISSSRYGGAITAGLFLKHFVDPATPWAHMDIAGPAFAERESVPYIQRGGTGYAVRMLLQYLRSF